MNLVESKPNTAAEFFEGERQSYDELETQIIERAQETSGFKDIEETVSSKLPVTPGSGRQIFQYTKATEAEKPPIFVTQEEVNQAIENVKQLQLFTSSVAAIVNLQRDVDRLQDNLARVFKELGHEHTWNKIINA